MMVRSRFEMAGFGLLTFPIIFVLRSRKRFRHLWIVGVVISVLCLSVGITACGGGSGGGSGPITRKYTTAPGTYKLTITASSSSVNSTQTLTLVVN
jgi:hypothetical protein